MSDARNLGTVAMGRGMGRWMRCGWALAVVAWMVTGWGARAWAQAAAAVALDESDRTGQEWEGKLLRGDYGAVTSRVDWIRITTRALSGLPGTPQAKAAFVQAMATNAAAAHDRRLRMFSGFRFLGSVRTNEAGGVVLRMLLPDGGVDFHRYRLERGKGGVAVSDLFVVSNGEWFGDSARRAYVLAEARKGAVWTTGVKPVETELMRSVAVLDRALGLAQKGLAKEVLEASQGFSATVQADRAVLLMRLSAAMVSDPALLASLSADWARLHPTDPGLDLLTFEKLARDGQHARSAEALLRIETFLGGDPHLHALAGAELALAGKLEEGRRMVEQSVSVEPGLATGHDAAIGIALHFKQHAEVARCLDRAADFLATDPKEVVRTQPQYEAFRSSPEGVKWMETEPEAKVVGGVRRSGGKLPPAVRSDPTLPEPPPTFGKPSASTNRPAKPSTRGR